MEPTPQPYPPLQPQAFPPMHPSQFYADHPEYAQFQMPAYPSIQQQLYQVTQEVAYPHPGHHFPSDRDCDYRKDVDFYNQHDVKTMTPRGSPPVREARGHRDRSRRRGGYGPSKVHHQSRDSRDLDDRAPQGVVSSVFGYRLSNFASTPELENRYPSLFVSPQFSGVVHTYSTSSFPIVESQLTNLPRICLHQGCNIQIENLSTSNTSEISPVVVNVNGCNTIYRVGLVIINSVTSPESPDTDALASIEFLRVQRSIPQKSALSNTRVSTTLPYAWVTEKQLEDGEVTDKSLLATASFLVNGITGMDCTSSLTKFAEFAYSRPFSSSSWNTPAFCSREDGNATPLVERVVVFAAHASSLAKLDAENCSLKLSNHTVSGSLSFESLSESLLFNYSNQSQDYFELCLTALLLEVSLLQDSVFMVASRLNSLNDSFSDPLLSVAVSLLDCSKSGYFKPWELVNALSAFGIPRSLAETLVQKADPGKINKVDIKLLLSSL
ncbi:hypothetical protein P9112_003796 [Eukaryota sp. TZLM1-RC]